MTDSTGYPTINRLLQALKEHNIRIEVLPLADKLKEISFIRLHFHCSKLDCRVFVDDEYGDGRPDSHQALLLHLLLRGCAHYMAAEDFLVWCKEHNLDPASIHAREIHFELREAVPRILEILGPEVQPVSDFDYNLGAGPTGKLRSMKAST